MKGSRLASAALIVAGLAAGLGLAELCARYGVLRQPRAQIDRVARGPKPRFRLLVLGDSFVEGRGGLALLLWRLTQDRGGAYVNLAVPGFGPVDYLRSLRRYGLDYHPDVVLLCLTATNDVTDTALRTEIMEVDDVLEKDQTPSRWRLVDAVRAVWFSLHSRDRADELLRWAAAHPPAGASPVNPFLAAAARAHPDYLAMNLDLSGATAQRAWEENERLLAKAQDLATAGGARLLVTLFPAPLQVNASHEAFFRGLGFQVDAGWRRRHALQDRFAAFCGRRRLECLDLLPEFRRSPDELYRPADDHLNDAGIALAFLAISRRLDGAKLIPEEVAAAR